MSVLARVGHRLERRTLSRLLTLALASCGGTDIVARQHLECSAMDAACDDGGEVEDADVFDAGDAASGADAGTDAEVDADANADDAGTDADMDAEAEIDAGPDAAPDAEMPLGCGARTCGALSSETAFCAGSGNAVQAGDSCEADAGPSSSRYAFCTCRDLVSTKMFNVDAFRGTLQTPAPDSAPIGVNLDLTLSGSGTIDGEAEVVRRQDVAPDMHLDGLVSVTTPPCRCEAEALLDIAGLIAARQSDHDNAREGLRADELDGFLANKELTLPCGRYYFTRLKSEFPLTLRTRGNVAIFVENNIELNNALSIVTEGAGDQVSVFVGGNVLVRGALKMGGDPNGAARVNLYVNGTGTINLGGSAEIAGQVYAPHTELVTTGTLQVWGSIFVRRAGLGADALIHYDTNAAAPTRCEAP